MSTLGRRSVTVPDRVAKVTRRKPVVDQEFVGVSYKPDNPSFDPSFHLFVCSEKGTSTDWKWPKAGAGSWETQPE